MNLVQIVPALAPSINGVGDHARLLAAQLRQDYGVTTHFIVGDPAWDGPHIVAGFPVTRLAARIREQGLDVFGIGEKKTPEAFRMACKRFIYVENLGAADDAPEPAPARGTARTEQPDTPKPGTKEAPAKAIPFIVAAMRAIDPDAEWYSLGQVGQFITQGTPDFDTRTYGSAKLSDLVRKISRFEVRPGPGGQLQMRDVA